MTEPRARCVWVVEDSALDAERARAVLTRDYRVRIFHDGSAALEELSRGASPDVMVLDWVMPGVSGPEVCRFLRASSPSAQSLGVLMLTAHRHTEQIVEGLEAGANDYLAKPYENDELLARVGALVRGKQLIERAERAEAITRQLFESAPDALLAIHRDGTLAFANKAASRIFDKSGEDLIGRKLSALIAGGEELLMEQSSETPLLRDVTIGARTFAPTVFFSPGGNSFTTVSLRDVTEQRSADARKLDFYSVIAHDLRTPLNAIALRTELILRGKHGSLPDGLATDVRKIDSHVHALVSLINDFLDLARMESAPDDVRRTEVDLAELLKKTKDDFEPLLENGQLTWCDGPVAVPSKVSGDQQRLAQVISNLVANAIKFTPPGGTITTGILSSGSDLECFVADTGCGVSAQDLPRLFQRYARASVPNEKVRGTGLGLMIVREIVEAHGGTVWAESSEGRGSRFAFRLPRSGTA